MMLAMLLLALAVNRDVPETLTVSCAAAPACSDRSDEWPRLPRCAEYELDSSLIGAAEHGDKSALDLLRRRYDTTESIYEKHRIAAALLHRAGDEATIWRDHRRA